MQHLQLATVMAEGMCLCMEGLSVSPNCSSAMQLQAEQPASSKYLRSSTNLIGGCGGGEGGISTGCDSSPGQLALGDPA